MAADERITGDVLGRNLDNDAAQSLLETYTYDIIADKSYNKDTYRSVIRLDQELRRTLDIDHLLELDTYSPIRAVAICAGTLQAAADSNRGHIDVTRVAEFLEFAISEGHLEYNPLVGQVPWYRCDNDAVDSVDLELSDIWEVGHTRVHLIALLIPILSGLTAKSGSDNTQAGLSTVRYDSSTVISENGNEGSPIMWTNNAVPVHGQILLEEFRPHLQEVSIISDGSDPFVLTNESTDTGHLRRRTVNDYLADVQKKLDVSLPGDMDIDEYLGVQYHNCCVRIYEEHKHEITEVSSETLCNDLRDQIGYEAAEISIEDSGVKQTRAQFDRPLASMIADLLGHFCEGAIRNAIRTGVTDDDPISFGEAMSSDIVEDDAITIENPEALYAFVGFIGMLAVPLAIGGTDLPTLLNMAAEHPASTIAGLAVSPILSPWRTVLADSLPDLLF